MDVLLNRRGSWNVDHSDSKGSAVPVDRTDHHTRVRMLAMTGKSLSLNSLDAEEEDDDDEDEDDYMRGGEGKLCDLQRRQAWSMEEPGQKERSLFSTPSLPSDLLGPEADTGQSSPNDSNRSSPTGRGGIPDGLPFIHHGRDKSGSDEDGGGDLGVSPGNAKSMSDLTSSNRTPEGSHHHHTVTKRHTFEEGSPGLGVPQATITKSLSTPSIPQATKAAGESRHSGRQESKHRPEKEMLLSFAQDFDAFLSRQKEIEEVEEEDNHTIPSDGGRDRKSEISWKDFLSEEQSPNDSDEKSSSKMGGGRKEEKRRKPSVFSRFQSSYRTKKNKEKEIKSKDGHRFVVVSCSNSSLCDVCRKPMANKAALRCENCLMNVHENCCRDLKAWCDKSRPPKALQRDGSSHGSHGGTTHGQQVAQGGPGPGTGTSLRPSNSFKDKRSYSAPVKPPQTNSQLPAPVVMSSHRHSLPSSSYAALYGSPPSSISLGMFPPTTNYGRFSLIDKAISEETESDGGSGMEPISSNMTETISESMESLDAVTPGEMNSLDDEPDLQLMIDEPDTWNMTVDKRTLKKMNAKDMKRQDTIWELIQTEKQYVKRLKIMQKIFAHNMLEFQNFTFDQVERLFPRLDELVELHCNFLRTLLARQTLNQDRSIDEIGDLLLGQFQDIAADKMKSVYGVFCSKHTEAMQLYKEIYRTDRKFQAFVKTCTNLSVCEKKDISDFILGVTVRLAKYPILLEAILKCTKDKKDRESISQALHLSKGVVQHVDSKVASYMKLVDIQSRLESRAVIYRGKKFKRQDLTIINRELIHSGKIGWENARGRIYEIVALVLTDLIVFLQQNEQKFTFLMQDSKPCVIPLHRLLVREKNDVKDSLGIFLISQDRSTPEMFKLVCQSKAEREDWMHRLSEAIRCCPSEPEQDDYDRQVALTLEEERKRREERANQINTIIRQLDHQDTLIKECCDEKNKLMNALMGISSARSDNGSRPNSQEFVCGSESMEIVQAAMQEASRLTVYLQGSGTHLSRSISSVGERVSHSYVATPIPKRAETFAGFDSSHENQSSSPKLNVSRKQHYSQMESEEEEEGGQASDVSLDQPELTDSGHIDGAEDLTPVVESFSQKEFRGGNPSPLQHSSHSHLWEEQGSGGGGSSDRSSDGRGSLDELISATASVTSPLPSLPNPNMEQITTSIGHLVQYLTDLMDIMSKQNTQVESMRVELKEAKKEIAKLSVDMHGPGRRAMSRHDQLEELRNLQENISREKQEWERTKAKDRSGLEMEREKMEEEKKELEKEKAKIRFHQEELKRQREALQAQIDMNKGGNQFLDHSESSRSFDSPHQRPIVHRRSASADFYNSVDVKEVEAMQNLNPTTEVHGSVRSSGFPRQARLSVGSLQGQQTGNAYGLPMHLLSARNEQRVGGVNVQRLPLKLAGSTNTSPTQQASVVPSKSFASGIQQPFPSRPSGITRVQSMSASSRSQTSGQLGGGDHSRSAPSNLTRLMKLADPKGGKSSSPSSGSPSGPTHKPPLPQANKGNGGGGPAPGAPASKSESEDNMTDSVIYF